MDIKIYIKNSVFIDSNLTDRYKIDKSIDEIGGLCIAAIGELFREIPDTCKDVPVFFGSAYSSLNSLHNFNVVYEKTGALHVNPSLFPNTVLNSPFCRASIYHGITSPVYNISNGRFSGLEALELAFIHLINGESSNAIVCAAEENCNFVKKIEKREILNSCVALYLTIQNSELEIQNLVRRKNSFSGKMDNSNYGSTNVLRIINNIFYENVEAKELIFENSQGSETVLKIKYHKKVKD